MSYFGIAEINVHLNAYIVVTWSVMLTAAYVSTQRRYIQLGRI